MRFNSIGILLLLACALTSAYSSDLRDELTDDIRSYCEYIAEKNTARKTVLLAPDVIVRAQNSDNDYLNQNNLIAALSKDIADLGKSKQIKQLIIQECDFYRLKQEATLQIQFALAHAQRQALQFKLKKIRQAKARLIHIVEGVQKRIKEHNDTLSSYYKTNTSLQTLDEAERDIYISLASAQPAPVKTMHLKQLLTSLARAEQKRQFTLNKLERLKDWSLQVQLGAQQNVSAITREQSIQPYAGLFARYNLGSFYANHKRNHALTHYAAWKKNQVNGIQRKLHRLIQSIAALKRAEETKLASMQKQYTHDDGLARSLNNINSLKARELKQHIDVNQIMDDLEIAYLRFYINELNSLI